jgi:hypothetical protein
MILSSSRSDYRIFVATTKDELEAAYRLRYEVFYEEGGDARYANHELRHWRDEDDGEFSKTLICQGVDGVPLGTVRLTWLRDHNFIASDVYDFGLLSSLVKIEELELKKNLARFDRAVVALSKRRSRVFFDLFNCVLRLAIENSTWILVGAANADSATQHQLWKKLGWKPYSEAESRNFRATAFYLDLRESVS